MSLKAQAVSSCSRRVPKYSECWDWNEIAKTDSTIDGLLKSGFKPCVEMTVIPYMTSESSVELLRISLINRFGPENVKTTISIDDSKIVSFWTRTKQ